MGNFSTSKISSFPTLIEGSDSSSFVKYGIEQRENKILKSFFWKLRTIKVWCEKDERILNWINVYKCCVFDWSFDGRNRNDCDSEVKNWIPSEMKARYKTAHFVIFGLRESGCMNQKNCYLFHSSSMNRKCSKRTSVGEIIIVVTEKYEFEYRNKTRILNNY